MATIMTVNGPIQPEELGFASMHEHVLCNGRVFRERYEAFLPEDGPVRSDDKINLQNLGRLKHAFIQCWDSTVNLDVELMSAELIDFKQAGGSAVVDMSAPGLRVDPLRTLEVSQKSDVHIIASTGLYAHDSWPERFQGMTSNDMEDVSAR